MKTILVFYLGTKLIPPSEVDYFIQASMRQIDVPKEDYLCFWIPLRDSTECWIDCINPVLLSETEYADMKDKLKFIEEQYLSLLKKDSVVDTVIAAVNDFEKQSQENVEDSKTND